MIKITIEKTTSVEYTETDNLVIEKIPTDYQQDGYGGRKEVVMHEKFAPQQVTKVKQVTVKLLEQQIEDESLFNLNGVIAAINGLQQQPVFVGRLEAPTPNAD